MESPMERDEKDIEDVESQSSAWNPDYGIVLEWWGRAEGLDDEQ